MSFGRRRPDVQCPQVYAERLEGRNSGIHQDRGDERPGSRPEAVSRYRLWKAPRLGGRLIGCIRAAWGAWF